MSVQSTLLLQNTDNLPEAVGTPIRVDEGYGHAGQIYTIAIYVSNFMGSVHIEASLVNEPGADDWFNIVDPLRFPRLHAVNAQPGETAAVGLSVPGNFSWVRARMDRKGLPSLPPNAANPYGFVDRILLNR